jgi:hypothetical protein
MDHNKHTKQEVMEKAINNIPDGKIPMMEVNIGNSLVSKNEKEIVKDEQMVSIWMEIMNMARDDRKQVDDLLENFINIVLNEGDASTSSKEALVALMKIKTDIPNNMTRMFDLLARIKMKDKSIPEVVAKQVNKFNIGGGAPNKRKLLESMAKEAAKKKED